MNSSSRTLSVPELSLRLRQQELVAEFARFALQTNSYQGILDRASEVAAEGLEARFAKVLEYLPDDMVFLVRSGVGWQDGVVGIARLGADLQSPAGYAFQSGKPVISNHLAKEQRFRTPKILAEHGIRSAINVLVHATDTKPYGVLEGDSTSRSDFNMDDLSFLQALANTLAVAVEAQKRQDEREDLLREKEDLLARNQALLDDKDLMMQEVHHRVMNSLQLVRTILSMQARTLTNEEAREQIEHAANRIMTVAAAHRRLYDGGSITATDAEPYLRGLLVDMTALLPDGAENRSLELQTPAFSLSANNITPLGLIVVELVTNALKYGRGTVSVEISRETDGLTISVSDEGDGFPAGFDPASGTGLGMRVVIALTKSREGEAIHVDRSVPFGRILVRTTFGGTG